MLYTWTWYQAHRFEFARKTGFQVKQQFVTKTLIPRIFTKHITNDSMEKKNLHSNSKVWLYNVPLSWQDTGILKIRISVKNVTAMCSYISFKDLKIKLFETDSVSTRQPPPRVKTS